MKTLLIALIALASGCTAMESAMKGAATMAIDGGKAALEAQWPALKSDLLDAAAKTAKDTADRAVEVAVGYSAEKTIAVTDAVAFAVARKAGIDPAKYDYNADGNWDEGEMAALQQAIVEKEGRPWWIDLLVASGGLGLLFTGGKTARRYLKGKEAPAI